MKQTKTMYMHTLNGKPARYLASKETLVACQGRSGHKALLVATPRQIRREQTRDRITTAIRDRSEVRYGYVRVEVPR